MKIPLKEKRVRFFLKILFFMKLILILCFTAAQASALVYGQSINLIAENVSFEEALISISKQSNYDLVYDAKVLKNITSTSIHLKDASLDEALRQLFRDQPLEYTLSKNAIVVKTRPVAKPPAKLAEPPVQQKEMTGRVTDEEGKVLAGVSVRVKGHPAVSTNEAGVYTLQVNVGETVVFTSVGFFPQEVRFTNQGRVDVVMKLDVMDMEEVIVVGYGTQKKSDLTGAVIRVSMEDKTSQANVNLLQSLSGTASGVNVQGAGLAGGEPDLSIRGQTSLSANDKPLIVLDGIIYNGNISNINVSDVASIDILKDASAAAVYGSRSANGVILITTKKGQTSQPIISFNAYYGHQNMTNNPMKVMNADQYAIRLVDYYYQQDLYGWYKTNPTSDAGKPVRPDVTDRNVVAARLRTQEERDNYLNGNEINWVDEIQRVAPIQNYNVSMSGKNERSNYFVSGSYTDEKGILTNDNFKRFTTRINIESKVTDWISLGLVSSYSFLDYSGLEASLGAARSASPLANNKIGSADYDMFLTGETYMAYPFNNLFVDNEDTRNDLFLVASSKITVPWVKGLTYELNYSNTYANGNNNTFHPVSTPGGAGNRGRAIKIPAESRDWTVNNILTFTRSFGDHDLNATFLYSRENRHGQTSTLDAQGFDNPILGYNNMGLGTVVTVASTAWEENSLSYMARANYSFKGRYLLTATVRQDGFSGFGANKKFATFPSVSFGWVTSDESFFNDRFQGTYLKLRASYGKNGNQGIGRYSSFSRMGTNAYVYGSTTASAIYPSELGNDDLGWETTTSYNLGVDFGVLDRRVSGSIDIYKAQTTDVLVNRALPPAAGYPNVWTNIGAIDNKGIELGVTTVNLQGPFRWETGFVFSLNRDKITKLYGDKNDQDIGNSWFVGQPISAIYDYQMAGGLWTEADLYSGNILANWYPGQFKYVDQDGDGVIDPEDKTIIGYETPNYRFSISNTLSYKNFSFYFLINSIQGGNGYYLLNNSSVVNVSWRSDDVYRGNMSFVRPYWTPENGVNNSTGVYNSPAVESGIYESRTFVRLQDISLGYQFSANALKKMKVEGCQVYVAGKNLYTWTNWSGWDPETGTSNSPLMRNITVGMRLSFSKN